MMTMIIDRSIIMIMIMIMDRIIVMVLVIHKGQLVWVLVRWKKIVWIIWINTLLTIQCLI